VNGDEEDGDWTAVNRGEDRGSFGSDDVEDG
jgi:hypothetical protein